MPCNIGKCEKYDNDIAKGKHIAMEKKYRA
jgi:hypothetical protein